MIKVTSTLALAVLALGLASASFAGSNYAVTNDDNSSANTATVFKAGSHVITVTKTLHTGGTGLGGGYFAAPRVSIENNAACVFVADAGSSDIAVFSKATSFGKVGNYTQSGFSGDYEGMGLAASSDGKYLYAAYSDTENIAAWSVGSTCALTFVASAQESDYVAPISLTSDNSTLIVPEPNNEYLDSWTFNGTSFTETSHVSLASLSVCSSTGCYLTGSDSTTVSSGKALVVLGNATLSGPYYVTAVLDTTTGFSSSSITNTTICNGTLANIESPVFSKAGVTGSGTLYFGAAGFGSGYPAGTAVASISGTTITAKSAGCNVNSAAYYASNDGIAGQTANSGNGAGIWQVAVSSSATNTMDLFAVNATTGAMTSYASLSDPNGSGTYVLSLTAFPPR